MKRSTAIWILAIIVLAGVGVRSYHLTARSLWFDEAFSWRLVQFPVVEMVARDAADVHPPLYYLLLQGWSVVFGSSLLSLRSFSVFLAGLTLIAVYLFATAATRKRAAGLWAAGLMAFSGFQIQFAWEARMYTLGTFLALVSSWLLLLALRKPRWWLWVLYGLVTAGFAYTHYYSFFTILAQVLFILGWVLFSTRLRVGEMLQSSTAWYAALSGLIMFVAYIPWIPVFLRQNGQVQEQFWIPRLGGWSVPDTFYRMWAPTNTIPQHSGLGWILLALVPIVLTGLGLLFLLFRRSNHKDGDRLVFLLAVFPFLISITVSILARSLYQDRFFVFAHLFIVIGLAMLLASIKKPMREFFVGTAVLGLMLFAFVGYWQELNILAKPGTRAATEHVFIERNNSEPIVVTSPFVYFGVLHYAEREFVSSEPKLYSETGELSHFSGGPILTPEDIIGPDVFAGEHDTVWVVDTTGFGGNKLEVPSEWLAISEKKWPEVFAHQGEVFVTEYQRQ